MRVLPRVVNSLPFRSESDHATAVPLAVAHLRRGAVLAHPTETVYGFGGVVTSAAIARVARLKGRDAQKPMVVLIHGAEMLGTLGLDLTPAARQLVTRFWPGALTLVLAGGARLLPSEVRGPSGIAVRWTSHDGMQAVIRALGEPITSTSANVSGLPPARSAAEIAAQWAAGIDSGDVLVLDGGTLENRQPSTVVDCSAPVPRVIREGVITVKAMRETVPGLVAD